MELHVATHPAENIILGLDQSNDVTIPTIHGIQTGEVVESECAIVGTNLLKVFLPIWAPALRA
jgi:hypothetical protein